MSADEALSTVLELCQSERLSMQSDGAVHDCEDEDCAMFLTDGVQQAIATVKDYCPGLCLYCIREGASPIDGCRHDREG
jgi:hypothetical protein